MIRPRRLPWMLDAACLEHPRRLWFTERSETGSGYARQICRRCLVRQECLVYAVEQHETLGIWGGYGHKDFKRLRRPYFCRLCGQRLTIPEVVSLDIARTEPRRWCCRECRQMQVREFEGATG